MKLHLKERAIALRGQGLSYREILEKVPVAKSTLSDWLHSVGLSKRQKQRLTEKKLAAARRGAEAKHRKRIEIARAIMQGAQSEIGEVTGRELWLMGIMLYWAEGSKEKTYCPGSGMRFTNSDPDMIRLLLKWLQKIFSKEAEDIIIDLYIHALHENRTSEIIAFWANAIGYPISSFRRVYYKKGNPKTKRKNIGASYHGLLRISVRSSSAIQRKIAGWIQGVVESSR